MKHLHKGKSIQRLERALRAITDLKQQRYDSTGFDKWHRDTEVAIENTFGNESRHAKDYAQISFSPIVFHWNTGDSQFQESYIQGLGRAASVLQSMIDEIKEYWEDDQVAPTSSMKSSESKTTNEIFVVHGRDGGAKEAVAGFLRTLELEPVVLNEQPNQGLTIIEKFEHHASGVGFAIVLFTPDDTGSLQDEGSASQPRARQNVVLELGYFLGKLGRDRTCALLKGGVEIPSDYYGVLYIEMDDGEDWKMKLLRELKEAGFDIDANRMYR